MPPCQRTFFSEVVVQRPLVEGAAREVGQWPGRQPLGRQALEVEDVDEGQIGGRIGLEAVQRRRWRPRQIGHAASVVGA